MDEKVCCSQRKGLYLQAEELQERKPCVSESKRPRLFVFWKKRKKINKLCLCPEAVAFIVKVIMMFLANFYLSLSLLSYLITKPTTKER